MITFEELVKHKQTPQIVLYHVSNPLYRDSISQYGLIPQKGASYMCHYGDNHMGDVVFVSTKNNYDSTYDDDRWKITLTQEEYAYLEFNTDKEVSNGLYTKKVIPSRCLTLIHKGVIGADYNWGDSDTCNNLN